MMNPKIFKTADDVVRSLAEELKRLSQQDKPAHISLSGGSTPKMLFTLLATNEYATGIEWGNLHFWWGDERCVAPDNRESNFGEANALLFSHITIPAMNIHRIHGEDDPEKEAARFTEEMRQFVPTSHDYPVFDWILLGVGPDGHTASLFPHVTDYNDPRLAIVASHPESGQLRISKTAKVLNNAKRITFLVLGSSKQTIVQEIQATPADELPYPAAKIHAVHGITEWYLDQDAAQKIA